MSGLPAELAWGRRAVFRARKICNFTSEEVLTIQSVGLERLLYTVPRIYAPGFLGKDCFHSPATALRGADH